MKIVEKKNGKQIYIKHNGRLLKSRDTEKPITFILHTAKQLIADMLDTGKVPRDMYF